MEATEKEAVLVALNKLVNYSEYSNNEPFFFVTLYELIGRNTAGDINSIISQLCQALGTTIEAEFHKARGAKYEPLRYHAIPEGDVNKALEVAINNVLIASTDLDRMLRNKQYADRGVL